MVEDIKIQWLNFLKALTRSVVQINLYKPDHPQVLDAIREVTNTLSRIFDDSDNLTLTLDNDKLIVNSVPFLSADKTPNSIKNLFLKSNIQSVSFLKGLTGEDIKIFCKMQHAKAIDPAEFLKQNGVDKITLNKDTYTKIEENGKKPQTISTPQNGPAEAQPGRSIAKEIEENFKIEAALTVLAARATNDKNEQKLIVAALIKKMKNEMEQEIKSIIETHRKEKTKIENDINRTESVITSIADGVVTVNKEGEILMMNSDAEAMSGKSLKDVSGKQVFDISNLENQIINLANEIGSEDKKNISKEISQKGEKQISETIKKSTTIIQNEEGKIVGTVSIPTDEAKLHQMDKLKEDFIANMTHELRSPLTSIKAALELIALENKTTTASKNMLKAAIRNSDRLNALISDILDFSKLESGKMIFHADSVSPNEIVNEAIDAMKAWAKSKNINILETGEKNVPNIYADMRKTAQILINIMSNAIKFTPSGGKIEISIDSGKGNLSNFVFFSIKDTGCGIKKEDQLKIFEKFTQVASGEKMKGTGLGLSITKALVILQSGKISLESDYGKGSLFKVAMPVYRNKLDQPVPEQLSKIERKKTWWQKIFGIK